MARSERLSSIAEPYDAVVLAGGSARRLGGADKPGLFVGDRSMLDTVLLAVSDAALTVVVGPERPTVRPVVWAREDPPGGGPVAALAAALPHVSAAVVVLLAADLPFLDRTTIGRLLEAIDGHDGAMLVDDDGRDQLLVGAWRTAALRAAMTGPTYGATLGSVIGGLKAARLQTLAVQPPPWFDCDTEQDLASARSST